MKRKFVSILAASAAATLPTAAMALDTPTATVYGMLNISIDGYSSTNSSVAGAETPFRTRIASNSSYFGFKGVEELSPDYSAIFQLETGLGTSILDINSVFNRNTGVGFKGPFGQIMLGLWDTPLKLLHAAADPFYYTGGGALTNLLDSPGFGSQAVVSTAEGNDGSGISATSGVTGGAYQTNAASPGVLNFDRRQANSINYFGNFGAFNLRAQYGTGSFSLPNRDEYSASLMFQDMGITAGIAYEAHNNFRVGSTLMNQLMNPTGALSFDSTRDQSIKAILGYNIESTGTVIYGVMSALAYTNYFAGSYGGTGTAPAYGASSSYTKQVFGGTVMQKLGKFTPKISYLTAGDGSVNLSDGTSQSAAGYGANQLTLGATYAYSKRTEAYVAWGHLMNGSNATYTMSINGPAFNTATAGVQSTAPSAGKNFDMVSVGIHHVF